MKIEMYTKDHCPYCDHAKALLDRYEASFTEYNVTCDAEKISEMVDRAQGRWTVPQIFIDDVPMGGCDDLFILHHTDQLAGLLSEGDVPGQYGKRSALG